MSQKNSQKGLDQKVLHKELKKIIKKMQKIQKKITADEQPASIHEVDALTHLGRRYAAVIAQLATTKT